MDGAPRANQNRRTDWTRTNAASDATAQPGEATQEGQATRQTGPSAVIARLSGQPADGAFRQASFGSRGDTSVSYDRLDTRSQRLSEYGFTQNDMDEMGPNEVLGKVAEVWPKMRIHSPIGNIRPLVIGVAKTEGVEGLQALLEMTLKADTAGLMRKAQAIRGAG